MQKAPTLSIQFAALRCPIRCLCSLYETNEVCFFQVWVSTVKIKDVSLICYCKDSFNTNSLLNPMSSFHSPAFASASSPLQLVQLLVFFTSFCHLSPVSGFLSNRTGEGYCSSLQWNPVPASLTQLLNYWYYQRAWYNIIFPPTNRQNHHILASKY